MNPILKHTAALACGGFALLAAPLRGAELNATFNSATAIPVTAASYTATGNTANLTLNFAPPTGTNLTVVNNTGLAFIEGTFDNLSHGQTVSLTYGGITYPFVANYYGGTGNDLILHWANTRLLGCGANNDGELGNNTNKYGSTPMLTPADMSGVLEGKTIVSIDAGADHTLALCADGTLAAWGSNSKGRLGTSSSPKDQLVPALVPMAGALTGKTVVAIAAGDSHSLALCSDGTVAAWGFNMWGQLGTGDYGSGYEPRAVDTSGALAGKTVVAIGAGYAYSLALCSDGTMVAWGSGSVGKLGNNSTQNSTLPVAVDTSGALAGKQVVSIAPGGFHSVALCSDGTLISWGLNSGGQLGNNSTTDSLVPVLVDRSGALSGTGRAVTAVMAGRSHNLALCADGTLVAWGENDEGQLGDNTSTSRTAPVLVRRSGPLPGRTIRTVSAIGLHSMAFCDDGSVASWGFNYYGQLGDNSTTKRRSPVSVNLSALRSGERCMAGFSNGAPLHSIVIVASPPPPVATTTAAGNLTDTGAILNGSAKANGTTTQVSFEYGTTTAYGTTVAPSPNQVTGTTTKEVTATLSGLLSGTTYHYRIVATSAHGTTRGEDMTFTTTGFASLSDLTTSSGSLMPAFSSITTGYSATVSSATDSITITPTALSGTAEIRVNGVIVHSGMTSETINLPVGNTTIPIEVAAAEGFNVQTYTVTVTRPPTAYTFNSSASVPVTASSFKPIGALANLSLNFAPMAGTNLTIVNNTGNSLIEGTFDNLVQAQTVDLTFNGISYSFVANYYGGSGNDLVLHWANTRLLAWGSNGDGKLGNGGIAGTKPVAVDTGGALAGKILLAVTAGGYHSFALCSDGTLAGWGAYNQVGLGRAYDEPRPVTVSSGELANRTVVAVDAGGGHTLALCADGALVAWGDHSSGQNGNTTGSFNKLPVLVDRSGVLAGKTVTQIAAGHYHNLVLCSDGTLASWGRAGSLGNGLPTQSNVPVLVTQTGVLAGKTVVAIAAGGSHNLALCSDGTLAAWGGNGSGQLGNNSTTNTLVPVLVNRSGVLAGKTITAIAAGGSHSLVLCSDGSSAAWGENGSGELGDGIGYTDQLLPAWVDRTGVLAGKTVVAVDAGYGFSLARCSDGTMATWGAGDGGQLGYGGTGGSNHPLMVSADALRNGELFGTADCGFGHGLVMAASPPQPVVETLAASGVGDVSVILNGTVSANGSDETVRFEYGPSTRYGASISATPATVNGIAATLVSAALSDLAPDTLYHYRVVSSGPGGTVRGSDLTFSTTDLAALDGLTLDGGTLLPAFSSAITNYSATVPPDTTSVTLRPVTRLTTATVAVNGLTVASGTASDPIGLLDGNNRITIVVAEAGQTRSYTVTVTRLPEVHGFDTPASVPVTAGGLTATGATVQFALNHAPAVGADLTVVNNTGIDLIQGTFDNLAQGQSVTLIHEGILYPFVANYFGGSGNDLVLQWAHNRLLAWGAGALGAVVSGNSNVPVPVDTSGVLAGKTIIGSSVGAGYSLVWCADGNLAAWGGRQSYVGDGSSSWPEVPLPVLVSRTTALAGRTVSAIAAGGNVRVAACTDGTLAKWGSDGNAGSYTTPTLVGGSALTGRRAVAVAAGTDHELALCADGGLVAWGVNWSGQLGNSSTTRSTTAVQVVQDGVLFNKTIIGIGAGAAQSYAFCTDGTVAAWGANDKGQLGDGTTKSQSVPVWVDRSGVLAGKSVIMIAAGDNHALALCSDGTLAAWGYNGYGQLGDGTMENRATPVLVNQSGVLAGKRVVEISAGKYHSMARCADGTVAYWGANSLMQFGNGTSTSSSVPVPGGIGAVRAGERMHACRSGGYHTLALVAMPPPPMAETLAATDIVDTEATFNGTVNAQGSSTAVAFEYGLTTSYGMTISATPASLTGAADTAVRAAPDGLLAGTTYHYRMIVTSAGGTVEGNDMTFTTSNLTSLAGLTLSAGALVPEFSQTHMSYVVTVPFYSDTLTLTPVALEQEATVTVGGVSVDSGTASAPLDLEVGNTRIDIGVTYASKLITRTYTLTVTRLPAMLAFDSAFTVPVTASGFSATGNTANFALNFAPVPGTVLTVVENTGSDPIHGYFDNLAQGQLVDLTYRGVVYPFIANYRGGTGNDLVLRWANTRLLAWGRNYYGQLGNNSKPDSEIPVAVDQTGVLAGKSIVSIACGYDHSLALCSDGTLAAWGLNDHGRLGNGSTTNSSVPVLVNRTGVLAGKTVVAVAAGHWHNVALCSDGTIATWGDNTRGQLGNGSNSYWASNPVLIDHAGVLAGKTCIAVAAGGSHSLVLCSDGTLAAWGYNNYGQLGNDGTSTSKVPVLVDRTGVLSGKSVVAIAAGGAGGTSSGQQGHSLALCSDGTLAAWGANARGQLGDNSTTSSGVPVLVDRSGVLAGKMTTAISAGSYFNIALCSDGSMATWGSNTFGQLGDGSTTHRSVPVLVDRSGVLAGRTVVGIDAGFGYGLATCTDGAMAAWGANGSGQLGNHSTTQSLLPVWVNTSTLATGERFMSAAGGGGSSLGLAALPPPPLATAFAATGIVDTGATLNGSANASGSIASVSFDYGPTPAYGTSVAATPASIDGVTATEVSTTIAGLAPGVTYHYRVVVTSAGGTVRSEDRTLTTSTLATLAGLSLSSGTLAPDFASANTRYNAIVPTTTSSLTLTPLVANAGATVKANGTTVASGTASAPLNLSVGNNEINCVVAAADGANTVTYTVTVTRLPMVYSFASASTVPVTVKDFAADGNSASFALSYAPVAGTDLTVVNNTGSGPIRGSFDNLSQGQLVRLTHGGISYPFVADYFGGTGNDLVLHWATTRLVGWGSNTYGVLGNGTSGNSAYSKVPGPVDMSGVLAGKSVVALADGGNSTLALCSDGSMAIWGMLRGSPVVVQENRPIAVDPTGALVGKTVVAVAAGYYHRLALCSDGSLAAWGGNGSGQVGDNSTTDRNEPVAVDQTGVLAGKTIIAVAAAEYFSLALCSDGTVAAWGSNQKGQLGNGSTTPSSVPVLVERGGVLAGKMVTSISAGPGYGLALCSDGAIAGWGINDQGQLGNNGGVSNNLPVLVDRTGVLAGKTVVAISAGSSHSLALCLDGSVATWGRNSDGQLGNGTTTTALVPVWVDRTGVLDGRTVANIFAGSSMSLVWCADRTLVSWGYNSYHGQLGNNSTTSSSVPVWVDSSILRTGEQFAPLAGSPSNFALVASPPPPQATTLTATAIRGTSATLEGSVYANENVVTVAFEYGLDEIYGDVVTAAPATVTGKGETAVSAPLSGLTPGTLYHYRVVGTSDRGFARGADMTFTTLSDNAHLVDLGMSGAGLTPDFDRDVTSYLASVPFEAGSVTVTPVTEHFGALPRVGGTVVTSGTPGGPIHLEVGNNPISILVTAEDGITTKTYTITVTRLPENFVFGSASDVPVTADGFTGGGVPIDIVLNYAPTPGAVLTMVNNTSLPFIHGTFGNLSQGRHVTLSYDGKDYDFVANYFGGTGNDLVLQWAATKALAWGLNSYGQVGDDSTIDRLVPTRVDDSGVLSGRILTAVAGGYLHSLALCSDGTVAAWGYNAQGQLGGDAAETSSVPMEVDHSGVLAGKTAIAISAGPFHNLALCSDGTITAWGYNNYGQLGNGDTETSRVPVRVNPVGALAGKHVVAVAAAAYQSYALCDDGSVAGWGYNDEGELGDGTTANSLVPVAVDISGALAGKRVASISAGQYHVLALCTDGTPVAWGYNNRGQLGDGTTTTSGVPVKIGNNGVLAGKRVVSISAGNTHSLALCADGTLASWGYNPRGQLGTGDTVQSLLPVAADLPGLVPAAGLAAGLNHGLVRFTDGSLAAWGDNAKGQLGDGTITQRLIPNALSVDSLDADTRFMMRVASGSAASHSLAIMALPELDAAARERWAQATAANPMVAAEDLIRHAFGVAPGENPGHKLPRPRRVGDRFEVSFSQPAGVTDVVYGAEWSATLLPGSWKDVPDTGAGGEHVFALPMSSEPRIFMRLKVVKP